MLKSDRSISAILLAAGVGRRLGQEKPSPKVLLDFDGKTLLARHLAALAAAGVTGLTIVVGYEADQIRAAVAAASPAFPVTFAENPRFREGSAVSMATAAETLQSGQTIIFMDGDVLYDHRMHARLLDAEGENVMLVDWGIEPGDEPVKICFDEAGTIVDFRKIPEHVHVKHGESVGFFRFSPTMAASLADLSQAYAADERATKEYEEVIRDHLLAEPARFAAADVSDLPWTEIDFPEDVAKAREAILPALED